MRPAVVFLLLCASFLLVRSTHARIDASFLGAVTGPQRALVANAVACPPEDGKETPSVPRRNVLSFAAAVVMSAVAPEMATAAPPLTMGEADGLAARAERKLLRPKPPKVLRSKLKLDFAVLLMRSSYNALDELDCVPMDQFQRDFFLLRQAEYQPYVNALGPGVVQQGDLVDPNYFDFISFAQYAAINREIKDPYSVFEEQQPVTVGEDEPQRFDTVVVKRTVEAERLVERHGELVGAAVIDKFEEVFGKTEAAIPALRKGGGNSAEQVLAALRQLAVLFVINGFAWESNVVIVKGSGGEGLSGTRFMVTMTSPATLWSGKALKARGADPTNNFYFKAAKELLKRGGVGVREVGIDYQDNREITMFTIA